MEVPEYLLRTTKYWTKLQTIAMVLRTRQVSNKISEQTHYCISSLPFEQMLKVLSKPSAATGRWRTNCISRWMWLFAKMPAKFERMKGLQIWRVNC